MGETAFLNIGKDRIAYQVSGNSHKPAILWVHGVMASKSNWRYNLPVFNDAFYNVAVDLLGHGESDKPRGGDYSIAAQAGRLATVMDGLGIEQFNLVGHSLGGTICLYLAATQPKRILKVVNTSGVLYIPRFSWRRLVTWLSWLGAVIPGAYHLGMRVSTIPLLRPTFRRIDFYNLANCPADFETEEVRDSMMPGLDWSTYASLRAIEQLDLRLYLGQITSKVMTVHGRQDTTVPIQQAYLINKLIADHRLEVVDYCGHSLMVEQALHYNQQVMNFLKT